MQLSIKVNDRELKKRINILNNGLQDYKKPLEASGKYSVKKFYGNFSVGGSEFQKWKPLKPATLRAKAQMGYPLDILVRTGTMKRSFKIMKLEKLKVAIGNKLQDSYFKYHQLGGKKIPKRLMIGFNKGMSKYIVKEFQDYLKFLLKK